MDLPTCPACGQSVLDDEAEDCPFCGASMSGKPSAKQPVANKPATKQPAAHAKPPQPSEAASKTDDAPMKSRSTAPPGKPSADDDDPFAVDSSKAKKEAIPLRPKPAPGRTHEVVCPMCETSGYTSPKAGGREVRCANPECLVPVFTAPEVKIEKPPAEPEKSGLSATAVLVGGLLLAVIGGAVWYFGFRQPDPPGFGTAGGTPTLPAIDPLVEENGQASGGDSSANAAANAEKRPTPLKIRAAALDAMQEACRQRDNNHSPAYCRRLTAAAMAHAGDLDGARAQIERLAGMRPRIPHYEIQPLVEIVWQQMNSGSGDDLKQTLDAALAAAADLPTRGLSRLEFAVELAALLTANRRMAAAQQLIEQHQERSPAGRYAAEVTAARALDRYNFDEFAQQLPIGQWAAPQTTAVVYVLAGRGQLEAANKWAAAQQDQQVRTEATIAWADLSLQQTLKSGKTFDMAAVDAAAANLPPAGRARMYARLAARQLAAEQSAEELLQKAGAELAQTAPPRELTLPDMKGLLDFKPPPAEPLRMQALAAAELAIAEHRAGHADKAAAALQQAMQFLRGQAPSPLAIGRRLNEITDVGVSGMRNRLKQALELNSDNEARLAFNDYRRNAQSIADAARRNFDLQQTILAAAVRAGLLAPVAEELRSRTAHANRDFNEPWAETRLPWMLIARFERDQNPQAIEPVRDLLKAAAVRQPPAIDRVVAAAEQSIQSGNFKQAARHFEDRAAQQIPQQQRDEWRRRLAGRLIAQQKLDAAFEFTEEISNREITLRESMLWFAAAQAVKAGRLSQIHEIGDRAAWSATEVVSIYGGLVEALDLTPTETTAAANPHHRSTKGR